MRFTERSVGSGRVDREGGMIRGVKLLGSNSRNRRRYTNDAMAEAAPKYAGKKVYLDHPDRDRFGDDRKIEHWVGNIVNPRYQGGAIYGDIKLRRKHPKFEEIIEMAEEFPDAVGMSHVAEGNSRNEHGEEIVDHIAEIYSVDLVTEPATTAGFFESVGDEQGFVSTAGRQRGYLSKFIGQMIAFNPDLGDKMAPSLAEWLTVIEDMEKVGHVHETAVNAGMNETDAANTAALAVEDDGLATRYESYNALPLPAPPSTFEDLERFSNRLR